MRLGAECQIYQCRGCGLIFPNPMPVPRDLTEHYEDPEEYFLHSPEAKQANYDRILASIEELGVRPGRFLDVGAGCGEGVKAARLRGWEAVGLEPTPSFAEVARANSGGEVVAAKVEERPFPEASFDAITISAVLEHLYNPLEVIQEVERLLRPGGVVWVGVPNEAGAFYRLGNSYHRLRGRDWVVNLSPTFPPYHVFGFTPGSVACMLRVAGLQVLRVQTYATPEIIDCGHTPVPPRLRPLCHFLLHVGARFGAGSYVDAWAMKPPAGNGELASWRVSELAGPQTPTRQLAH
jgi:SAM-dependent methyltransferase